MARPSVYSTELCNLICDHLRNGHYVETATALAGISARTYYRWLAEGEEDESKDLDTPMAAFCRAVKVASAEAEAVALETLRRGPQGWQAQAWFLERRFPKRWGSNRYAHVQELRPGEKDWLAQWEEAN